MPEAPHSPKLRLVTKLAYGLGDLGPALITNILIFFLLYFMVNVAGLDPGLAGAVMLIANIWDAVNDPIVGILSDRTRSRFGRRLPWILWGGVPFGLTFLLQWLIPTSNQWGLFGYYLLMALLANTFFTIVNLPYTALTPELTQDYNDRTSLNSFRFALASGGGVIGLLMARAILGQFEAQPERGYLVLGIVGAIAATLPIYLCVFGIWKPVMRAERKRVAAAEGDTHPQESLPKQIKIAFSNRPFLIVVGIYLCTWLAFQNTGAILPFYIVSWMRRSEQTVTEAALAVQLTAMLMLFVLSAVSRRYGKKATFYVGTSVWLIAQIGLYRLQPEQVFLIYPLAALVGIGVATAYLIPWSMLPDVIEWDELQTGQRREGIFYSFMSLIQKVCRGVALLLIGLMLKQAGFVERLPGQPFPEQPPAAQEAIRVATALFPLALILIGMVLVYFYPITREEHTKILLQLKERQRLEAETQSQEDGD